MRLWPLDIGNAANRTHRYIPSVCCKNSIGMVLTHCSETLQCRMKLDCDLANCCSFQFSHFHSTWWIPIHKFVDMREKKALILRRHSLFHYSCLSHRHIKLMFHNGYEACSHHYTASSIYGAVCAPSFCNPDSCPGLINSKWNNGPAETLHDAKVQQSQKSRAAMQFFYNSTKLRRKKNGTTFLAYCKNYTHWHTLRRNFVLLSENMDNNL